MKNSKQKVLYANLEKKNQFSNPFSYTLNYFRPHVTLNPKILKHFLQVTEQHVYSESMGIKDIYIQRKWLKEYMPVYTGNLCSVWSSDAYFIQFCII